jgi:hypothetical protein
MLVRVVAVGLLLAKTLLIQTVATVVMVQTPIHHGPLQLRQVIVVIIAAVAAALALILQERVALAAVEMVLLMAVRVIMGMQTLAVAEGLLKTELQEMAGLV